LTIRSKLEMNAMVSVRVLRVESTW
jgi:hypothetical protein